MGSGKGEKRRGLFNTLTVFKLSSNTPSLPHTHANKDIPTAGLLWVVGMEASGCTLAYGDFGNRQRGPF